MIEQPLKLNLIPGGVMPRINVSQYDTDSRTINATLYNGATLFEIPEGAEISVRGTKKDDTGFAYECTYSGSIVSFDITDQMTVYPGEVLAELSIYLSGAILGTANFVIFVETTTLGTDTDISETEIPAIIALAREQEENAAQSAAAAAESEENAATSETNAANSADDSEDFSLVSEGYARGSQNGTDVESGSTYYHNNSKYYSEHAAGSATSAAGSASDAEDSQQAALLSEQNAAASEEILQFYVNYVVPRFTIANNRLYLKDTATQNFIVANNRLYIQNPS